MPAWSDSPPRLCVECLRTHRTGCAIVRHVNGTIDHVCWACFDRFDYEAFIEWILAP
jgi:hypothetical protein